MAQALKVLGQAAPGASSETSLYVVPASTSAVVSSIVICNRGSGDALYRVAVVPGGGSAGNANYVVYDAKLLKETIPDALVIGITMATGDEIRVEADTADVSFSAFGTEVS